MKKNYNEFDLVEYLKQTYPDNEFEIKPFQYHSSLPLIGKTNVLYYISISTNKDLDIKLKHIKDDEFFTSLCFESSQNHIPFFLCSGLSGNGEFLCHGYEIVFHKNVYK